MATEKAAVISCEWPGTRERSNCSLVRPASETRSSIMGGCQRTSRPGLSRVDPHVAGNVELRGQARIEKQAPFCLGSGGETKPGRVGPPGGKGQDYLPNDGCFQLRKSRLESQPTRSRESRESRTRSLAAGQTATVTAPDAAQKDKTSPASYALHHMHASLQTRPRILRPHVPQERCHWIPKSQPCTATPRRTRLRRIRTGLRCGLGSSPPAMCRSMAVI